MELLQNTCRSSIKCLRCYSRVCTNGNQEYKCKLLVVGGGTGGCSTVSKFARKLRENDIIVLEPSSLLTGAVPFPWYRRGGIPSDSYTLRGVGEVQGTNVGPTYTSPGVYDISYKLKASKSDLSVHYYQPLFPLIAAGIKNHNESCKPLQAILPDKVGWLKDHAEDFDPCNKIVYTRCGDRIFYDFMVIAIGLKNDYNKIPGLLEALENTNRNVSTIYSPKYCTKTWCNIAQFRGGHAVFTYTKTGGKCGGAAQKIMYLADDYWKKHKIRDQTNITYNTGGDSLFGVPIYAKALQNIAADRNIIVNYCTDLVEINDQGAVFVDRDRETPLYITMPYNFLHVTPPMSPPICLTKCEELVTENGYLDVNKHTLQHNTFPNIYGIGDCTSTPNSKTAAAVAAQSSVLERNLSNTMSGKPAVAKYNGYGACSILTSYKKGIMAEFLYDKQVWETFPFDQSKERRLLCYLQTKYFPYLYWNKLVKGKWDGPSKLRNILHPFRK